MSMDYPRAWQIARGVPMNQHHAKCSFAKTDGGLLCDCDAINKHPESIDSKSYTTDGFIICPKCGGSGFSGYGTGYDDVCDECGGTKSFPPDQFSENQTH